MLTERDKTKFSYVRSASGLL